MPPRGAGGVTPAQTVGQRAIGDEREHHLGRVVGQSAPVASGKTVARGTTDVVTKNVRQQHARDGGAIRHWIVSCAMRSHDTRHQAGEQVTVIRPVVYWMRRVVIAGSVAV